MDRRFHPPSLGKTMRYSALHCGQATRAVLLPRCFSSTQRCRQTWCTHLVEPRQRHGRTHSAVRSSSSVAKQTQQLLEAEQSRAERTVNTLQYQNMTLESGSLDRGQTMDHYLRKTKAATQQDVHKAVSSCLSMVFSVS